MFHLSDHASPARPPVVLRSIPGPTACIVYEAKTVYTSHGMHEWTGSEYYMHVCMSTVPTHSSTHASIE